MERNLAPVIVFSFSRKECEAYAMQMSKLEFNTRELQRPENALILMVIFF